MAKSIPISVLDLSALQTTPRETGPADTLTDHAEYGEGGIFAPHVLLNADGSKERLPCGGNIIPPLLARHITCWSKNHGAGAPSFALLLGPVVAVASAGLYACVRALTSTCVSHAQASPWAWADLATGLLSAISPDRWARSGAHGFQR